MVDVCCIKLVLIVISLLTNNEMLYETALNKFINNSFNFIITIEMFFFFFKWTQQYLLFIYSILNISRNFAINLQLIGDTLQHLAT